MAYDRTVTRNHQRQPASSRTCLLEAFAQPHSTEGPAIIAGQYESSVEGSGLGHVNILQRSIESAALQTPCRTLEFALCG